ncbi:MAG: serine/threonine-protein kinase [Planctomycetota bacterium]
MRQKVRTIQQLTNETPGSLIPGYSILAKLGKGGMGSVFKAIQLSKNRLVAVKFLPVNLAKDKVYIKRFLREARSASQLNHTNITRVYEVGNYKGIFYFSMEYIDGVTLLGLMEDRNTLDVATSIDIIIQVARGLEHAHSHSIIHRDVKPENIMIANDGAVKICDMGLAKRMGCAEHDITVTGQVIGTPAYMSPEQIASPKTLDHRSDIYSLGATFYHVVTGKRPFLGDTSAQTMLNVIREPLMFPKGVKIPVQIAKVIKKMMAKEPSKRYQSAGELINELSILKETLRIPDKQSKNSDRNQAASQALMFPLSAAESLEGRAKLPLLLGSAAVIIFLVILVLKTMLIPEPAPLQLTTVEIPLESAPAEEHIRAGIMLSASSRWVDALSQFTLSTQVNPLSPTAWNNRGAALFTLGRLSEALESFNEAVRLSPGDAEIHKNRGATLMQMERYDEALVEFEAATILLPENASFWFAKSLCLNKLGRIKESEKALQYAKALNPQKFR